VWGARPQFIVGDTEFHLKRITTRPAPDRGKMAPETPRKESVLGQPIAGRGAFTLPGARHQILSMMGAKPTERKRREKQTKGKGGKKKELSPLRVLPATQDRQNWQEPLEEKKRVKE